MRRMKPTPLGLAGWVLVASFVLPQATCTIDTPSGGTILVDPDAALIAADLIRDIVFLNNADDDFFEDFDDHDDHHHDDYFFDWWH